MVKSYTRRQFLKKVLSSVTTTLLATTGGYIYARYIEPKYIEVTEHTIKHSLIPKSFHQMRIVQFSDTHIGENFTLQHFEKVVDKINTLQPDLVFFTGDLIDIPNTYNHLDKVAPILSRIKAPFGKYYIYGNHDHGGFGTDIYKNIMNLADFQLLMNSSITIKNNKDIITIAGVDDAMLGKPDFETTFKHISANTYTIILIHEPDIAPRAEELGAHLQLSGHTHGGQIKVPFIGPIVTPPLGNHYVEGYFEIGPSKMPLFVNRGLGTTRLPFRFLSRPEISVYTLNVVD